MKRFLVATVLFVSSLITQSAMAEVCKAKIVAKHGNVLDTLSGYGYNRIDACDEALNKCHKEQERRSYDNVVKKASCVVSYTRSIPLPVKHCSFNLINTKNQRIVYTFSAQAENMKKACKEADDKCDIARYEMWTPKEHICEKIPSESSPAPRPNRTIRRTCAFERISISPAGETVMQTYRGAEMGPQGTELHERACDSAMAKCLKDTRRNDRLERCIRKK